jgi:ectoine hydroxylase-related dioxygenase (phytanoyl-CoA dioxygenase family)
MSGDLYREGLKRAKEQYDRDGYAIFRQVLDAELVQEASNHIDWLLARNPGLRPEQLHHWLVKDDPFWVRLVSDDRLLDIAELFVGPNIALYASHYISKPPFDGQAVLWHQDGSYWPLEPMEVVTLWVAIDDSTPENGCMRVIPGTHVMELKPLRERTDVANVLGSSMDESLVDESKAVDVILKAGDVSVHHPNLVHGSNPNTSPRRRAGLTIRYIPTSTRILNQGPDLPVILLRGKAVPGVNTYHPKPRYVEGKHMPFRGCEAWR